MTAKAGALPAIANSREIWRMEGDVRFIWIEIASLCSQDCTAMRSNDDTERAGRFSDSVQVEHLVVQVGQTYGGRGLPSTANSSQETVRSRFAASSRRSANMDASS